MYDGKGDEEKEYKFKGMPHAYGMIPRTFEDPQDVEKVMVHVIGE